MAKKKSLNLGTILVFVGIILGIVALICLAGPGLTASHSVTIKETTTTTASIGLAGFLTGKYTTVTTVKGSVSVDPKSVDFQAGVSIFAIIALVLTILGIVATIVGVLLKKKVIIIVGGVLLLLSGICMFLLTVAGTTYKDVAFTDVFKPTELMPYKLGVGAVLYGVFGILGGLTTTAGAFLRK